MSGNDCCPPAHPDAGLPCRTGILKPLPWQVRVAIVAAAGILVLAFFAPLWHIHMRAPQYPKGLDLWIHMTHLSGGDGPGRAEHGDDDDEHHHGSHDHDNDEEHGDIREINNLNHYIGMRPIRGEDIVELDWMPFAFGILALLALRVAVIGYVRSLIDLAVLSSYVMGFGLLRFYLTLRSYGHDLDPRAAFKIEPFTPVLFGTKQVANFHTEAWPAWGSVAIFGYLTVVWGLLWWQLWVIWRARR